MATLRNKRKLAAVLRETPESTRNSRGQSTLDPDVTQDHISQVSEEIEGRVTKKLSKEFSRTESRILGAFSKLDQFLLNPQVGTCSVAVPGTSRNNNSENRGTTGDRSSGDSCPEARSFYRHSGQISSPEAEIDPHSGEPAICFWSPTSTSFFAKPIISLLFSIFHIRCNRNIPKHIYFVPRMLFTVFDMTSLPGRPNVTILDLAFADKGITGGLLGKTKHFHLDSATRFFSPDSR